MPLLSCGSNRDVEVERESRWKENERRVVADSDIDHCNASCGHESSFAPKPIVPGQFFRCIQHLLENSHVTFRVSSRF